MNRNYRNALVAITLLGLARPAAADVIGDWNTKALDFVVSHKMLPPPAERIVAMTQLAMFDAVNSIDLKYRPYLVQLSAVPTASKEAAAAAAAGTVLAGVDPQTQDQVKADLAAYLTAIPDGAAKSEGIKLGEAVAAAACCWLHGNCSACAQDRQNDHNDPAVRRRLGPRQSNY